MLIDVSNHALILEVVGRSRQVGGLGAGFSKKLRNSRDSWRTGKRLALERASGVNTAFLKITRPASGVPRLRLRSLRACLHQLAALQHGWPLTGLVALADSCPPPPAALDHTAEHRIAGHCELHQGV